MGKGAQRSPAHMSEAEEKTTADVLIGGYLYDVVPRVPTIPSLLSLQKHK